MTERLHFRFALSCIGEGNGNPLQCSCLENPRDGGAWWAAVYGVAQSRTQLKWLSSSSSRGVKYTNSKNVQMVNRISPSIGCLTWQLWGIFHSFSNLVGSTRKKFFSKLNFLLSHVDVFLRLTWSTGKHVLNIPQRKTILTTSHDTLSTYIHKILFKKEKVFPFRRQFFAYSSKKKDLHSCWG